ncbi:MAG: hypothetical protein JNN07_24565 [Verrucomicrobiales bacterium]|nr:hypothetical protein [Verrucomicrobiales bacterium]
MTYFIQRIASRLGGLVLLLAWSLSFGSLHAQGLLASVPLSVTLEADGSEWLHSASLDLAWNRSSPATDRRFECRFGFSTDETFVEGRLVDMISAVLLDASGRRSMVLFTLSAEGLSLMPQTADSLTVNLDHVLLEPIAVPASELGFSSRVAYRIQTPLPAAFAPGNVRLALAFDDNQDTAASRAWLEEIVLVPEPSGFLILTLAAVGLAVNFVCTRALALVKRGE